MNGIISYTDEIKKFISGKQYAGKNIQTSDGKTAYITKTGIAKPYNSADSLSNTNGCTTSLEQIGSAWGDMGIPVGSLMVDGQSCGYETSYVQSRPPKTTFDWKFYSEANPDLNLTTEQQANDHWTSTGIHQGLLPNPTILSSMSNVGKIGYVDVNTNLHTIPQEAYTYNGIYKSFDYSNVTGTSMQDCTVPPPSVKYGDQILIKYGEKIGSMNQQSVLEFGTEKTNLFLRPPVGEDALTASPIKYGDQVTIAMSSSNVQTTNCGWWGCKVGYVNHHTSLFSFGPGGDSGKTFIIYVPPGTNYTFGSEVKIGDPFALVALTELNDTLSQGETLKQGEYRQSLNNKYWMYYAQGTLYVLDMSPFAVIWSSSPPSSTNSTGSVTLGADGNLVVNDPNGPPPWSSNTSNKGQSPYSLIIENDGNLALYDANKTSIWSTNTSGTNPTTSWTEQATTDYGGNDINNSTKSLTDCQASCVATDGCVGIVTDNSGANQCWLKNKFGTGTANNNRNTYMLSTTTRDSTPTANVEVLEIGYVNSDNTMSFGSYDKSVGKNIFTFETIGAAPYTMSCNIAALQRDCNTDQTCIGFIHSNKENTWQKLSSNSSPDMYKITDTQQNIYVKEASIDMKDKSCKSGTPQFIDSDMFSNYPQGADFVMNGDQCNVLDQSEIQTKYQSYTQANQKAVKQGEFLVKTYPKLPEYTVQTKQMYNQLNTKTKEYKTVLNSIKTKKEKYNDTYKEQNSDLSLLESSNKTHVFLWGLSSIVVIAMVVMLKNRQT